MRKIAGGGATKPNAAEKALNAPTIPAKNVKPSARGTLRQAEHIVSTSSAEESRKVTRRARRRSAAQRRRKRLVTRTLRSKPQKAPGPKGPKQYKPPTIERAKAVSKPAKPSPISKPPEFQGKKTAGTPTYLELKKAKKAGTLKVNRKGFATTPRVRKAAKKLKRAKKAARKGAPKLTGPLSRGEKVFAKTVARETPLKPRTVAAWTMLEGGNQTGDYNRLNVGHTDSGPIPLTADPRWRNPKSAGKLTAKFLKGRYGGASEGIQAILPAARGKSPSEQLKVIANSGWATDPEYESKLQSTLSSVGAKPGNPKARKQLKAAKAEAAKVGLQAGKQSNLGKPPKKVLTRFKAAQQAAKELEKAKLPYVWGGGHGDPKSRPTSGGLDCSGAVGYVLNKMGAMKGSLVSGEFGSVLKPGPGAVTVFYNAGHVFMRIGNRYWGTSRTNPEGGPGFIEDPGDLSQYSVGHVPGLGKKVAVQMGISLKGTSFPGMTLSPSGTTATISGAGATRDKPGFSTKPISPAVRARRTLRKLEQLGVGVGSETETESSDTTLKELEAKYL